MLPGLCSSEPAPDAIDAQTLAQLGCLLRPAAWSPPPQVYAELQQRLAQRDSLLHLRQQVRNQLHALQQMPTVIAAVRTRMEQLIETLTAQLEAGKAELEAALVSDPTWAASAQRLQTIPGIGPLVAAWLLAYLRALPGSARLPREEAHRRLADR